MSTWAIDRGKSDVTALGVVVDVKKGYTHVCTLPAGTEITHHPSGNGVIAVHSQHPPKWIKLDGTVEEIGPVPHPYAEAARRSWDLQKQMKRDVRAVAGIDHLPDKAVPPERPPEHYIKDWFVMCEFAKIIVAAVPDSTIADAVERETPDDYVITEIPVTLGQVRAARKALGQHWSDCAVHNGPALPVGKCNCGGYDAK